MHTMIRNTLVNSVALALFLSTGAHAQNNGTGQAPSDTQKDDKKTELEKIVVTGSRIARAEVEGAQPVTIISAAQIKAEGFTTVFELVGSLTQSFPVETPPSWGSSSVNARQANLRGLGSDHTLVLIDGRRINDYPQPANSSKNFQNLNNIPTGMIDRVEILATGSSAIYGSDAIAGVINIILKHQYDGYDVDFKVGRSERGGRNYGDFNFVGGNSGDNWHIVYNFEAQHRSALFGRDRPYTDAESDAGYGAWNSTARQYGYQSTGGAMLSTADGSYVNPPSGACSQPGFQNAFRLQNSPTGYYCAQNAIFKDWVLTPGRDDKNGYIFGSYDFANGIQAYASVGLWRTTGISNTELPYLYNYNGASFFDQASGKVITNYFRQIGVGEAGTQGNTYDREQDWDIHAGLKGTVMDGRFNWDVDVGRSVYWVHESFTGLNEQGMFNYFFGQQLGTTSDGLPIYDSSKFWTPITPAQYSTFGVSGRNDSITWMNQASATVTGNLFDMWAGPLAFAGVLEANHQGFNLTPDPRGNNSSYSDPFLSLVTGGGERTRYSGAVEFNIPLHSTFNLTLAGRADRYETDISDQTAKTWSAKLEWRPIEGLLLRGSYGTNFHAPDMMYLFKGDSVQTVGQYRDDYVCILNHDTSCQSTTHATYFPAYTRGGPNLLPEEGHGWTYGFVWDVPMVEGLSLAADYWHMGINNIIQNIDYTTAITDEAGCITGLNYDGSPYTTHVQGSAYCVQAIANVKRDANNNILAVYAGPINETQLYVSGIDASVSYAWRTDRWGDFKFNLEWTDNLRYLQRTYATDPLINTNYNQPQTRTRASLNWKMDNWDTTLFGTRTSGLRLDGWGSCEALADGSRPSVGDANCTIIKGNSPAWIIYNASVGYQLNEHARLTFLVNNIFNKLGPIEYYAGGFEFIRANQTDYIGRELFMDFNYKF